MQWLIPALTGGLVVTTVWQGEQMRPKQVQAEMSLSLSRTLPLPGAGVGAAVLAGRAGTKAKRRRVERTQAWQSDAGTPRTNGTSVAAAPRDSDLMTPVTPVTPVTPGTRPV